MNKLLLIIVFILAPLIMLRAEDSFSAIMRYLGSSDRQHESKATQSSKPLAIKSLLIHPDERRRILGKAQYSRPSSLPESYITSDGNFKFHYTTSGYYAVDTTCTNGEGIPDYIYEAARAAEYVYRLLMDTLNYDPPPQDNIEGPETDIYILNFAGYSYAYTYPESEVSSTSRRYDYTAYMEIDNDYKETGYGTRGLDGLRVTIAHEYFHVVQLGYNWFPNNGLPSSGGDEYFLEWSSTWFEERAYPRVNDYIQYLGGFFYNPGKSIWDYNSYAYALGPFIYFLENTYDNELLRKVWENIKSRYAFQALINVLDEYNGSLANQYNNYVNACYFTGNRYDESYAVCPDAAQFPMMSVTQYQFNQSLSIPSSEIRPFATQPFAVSFTSDQFLNMNVDPDDDGSLIGSYIIDRQGSDYFYRNFDTQQDVFVGEMRKEEQLVVFLTNPEINDTIAVDMAFQSTETTPSKILKIYANPYIWQEQGPLSVELQLGKFISELNFRIFNILGQRVYDYTIDASSLEPGIHTFNFTEDVFRSRNLSSGVYLLQIRADDDRMVKKFTLLN